MSFLKKNHFIFSIHSFILRRVRTDNLIEIFGPYYRSLNNPVRTLLHTEEHSGTDTAWAGFVSPRRGNSHRKGRRRQ